MVAISLGFKVAKNKPSFRPGTFSSVYSLPSLRKRFGFCRLSLLTQIRNWVWEIIMCKANMSSVIKAMLSFHVVALQKHSTYAPWRMRVKILHNNLVLLWKYFQPHGDLGGSVGSLEVPGPHFESWWLILGEAKLYYPTNIFLILIFKNEPIYPSRVSTTFFFFIKIFFSIVNLWSILWVTFWSLQGTKNILSFFLFFWVAWFISQQFVKNCSVLFGFVAFILYLYLLPFYHSTLLTSIPN